jgi:predicted RNA-binding protein with PUA-like domain
MQARHSKKHADSPKVRRVGKITQPKEELRGGWLFKQEPDCYSYDDLERDGSTLWDGVSNSLARRHLWNVRAGDRVLYYHTGHERAIVGEMRVTVGPLHDQGSDDPKAVLLTVEPVRRWAHAVTLAQIKKEPLFAQWELVRLPRLSVMPVRAEQWRRLAELGGAL